MLVILVCMLCGHTPQAMATQWRSYPYAINYRRACCLGDRLYVLKGNTLALANLETWEIEQTLTREDGLSSTQIFDIIQSPDARRLAIIYDNGLIDVIHPDGSIWTIPDLYATPMPGYNKEILHVREQQGQLYIATGFGFMVVDLYDEVIRHTVNLDKPVRCAWQFYGNWYYCDAQGIYYCPTTGNLYNPGAWTKACSHVINDAIVVKGYGGWQCWLLAKDNSLRKIEQRAPTCQRATDAGSATTFHLLGHNIAVLSPDSLYLYDTEHGILPNYGKSPRPGTLHVARRAPSHSTASCLCAIDSTQLAFIMPSVGIEADSLHVTDERGLTIHPLHSQVLTVTNYQQSPDINLLSRDGAGNIGMTQVLSPMGNYVTLLKTPGFLTTYSTTQGTWQNLTSQIVTDPKAEGAPSRFVAVLDFAADPLNAERYWFSTIEDGVIGIDHGQFLTHYSKASTSSGLENYASGCTRVSGITFSPKGDLWCVNDGMTNLLHVLQKSDGKWYKFNVPGVEKTFSYPHFIHTQHNGRHQLWGCQEFKYNSSAVFVYDYGTSISDSKDDRTTSFKTYVPDQGAPFTPYYGRGIYEGPNGAIWLLNTSGLYVIDDPETVFEHPGQCRAVRTDIIPTAMATDAQQRLWVATESDGLYLLSADGLTTYDHLTAENSQLPTNEVLSVVFDAPTSTLWIATQACLLSYTYESDLYDAQSPWTSAAWCYPGSMARNARTTVQVFGLADDAELTVENSQGRILSKDTAWGGHATIDATTLPIGIYIIKGTDAQGHKGELCTFQIVEP